MRFQIHDKTVPLILLLILFNNNYLNLRARRETLSFISRNLRFFHCIGKILRSSWSYLLKCVRNLYQRKITPNGLKAKLIKNHGRRFSSKKELFPPWRENEKSSVLNSYYAHSWTESSIWVPNKVTLFKNIETELSYTQEPDR